MTPALLFLTLAALVGAGPLATVNKSPITGPQLIAELQRRHGGEAKFAGGEAKFAGGEAECRSALEAVIDRRLLLQEAHRLGLAEHPALVRALKELEPLAATDHLYKLEVTDRARVTDEEVRQFAEPGGGAVIQSQEAPANLARGHSQPGPGPEIEQRRIRGILESRKFEARRAAFHQELWAKHRVNTPNFSWSLAALRAAVAARATTEVASWTGGSLTMASFAERLNLELLAKLPLDHQHEQIDNSRYELIRLEVVGLEIAARALTRAPEVIAALEARRNDLLENLLLDEHVFKGITVTAEEEKKYYDTHRSGFAVAARRRLLQIVVPTEKKAQATLKKLAAGANFEALAKALAADPLGAPGSGDLGWVLDAKIAPEFLGVLKLEQGEVSAPIKTDLGFHLIKVAEVAAAAVLPFEQVKDDAHKVALRKKLDDRRLLWVRKLRAGAVISINAAEVQAFAKDNAL